MVSLVRQPSARREDGRARGTFSRTRREHAKEIAEDYVEVIADLIAENGEARVVDLARHLGVTHVTVNRTISRLQKAGYVRSQPYRAIFLTPEGPGHRLGRSVPPTRSPRCS